MDRKRSGVRPRGRGIQLSFNYRGVRCRETLAIPPTAKNLAYAEQKRTAILYAIETQTFDYLREFPKSSLAKRVFRSGNNVSVKELLETYLKRTARTVELSTIRDYKSAVYHHLIPEFGDVNIADPKPSRIKDWIASLAITGKRINNVLVPLRGAYDDAVRDNLVAVSPLAGIANLSHRARDPDPLSPDEINTVLGARDGAVLNLFQFAIWTGLRTSELIALHWFEVDLKRGVLTVRHASVRKQMKAPKTASGKREVKLLPLAVEALERQKALTFKDGGAVFVNPRTGKAWETDGQIRKTAWAPAVKRAGIRYRCAYQTRHTYASLMLSAGENPLWVASQMGHSDWGMIRKVYGRWIPEADPQSGGKAILMWAQVGHKDRQSA